jgi:hypothetical protein
MSLRTESQSVAEKKVLPVILEWKKQIDLAKGLDIGSDDELLASIMRVRQDIQKAKSQGLDVVERQMAHEEVAMDVALGRNNDWSGDDTLFNAVEVAHGKRVLLREHVEEFLSSRDVAPKTADMQRRDLMLFIKQFPYASDATRVKVREWVNVTLGTEQGLSLATRRR